MNAKVVIIAISLATLKLNPAAAQDNPQKFTLQQCLDFALNNSYTVRRSNLDIREADYQRQKALAAGERKRQFRQ